MPYKPGSRLPGERASKLGHLEVLQSDLVNRLCETFESAEVSDELSDVQWVSIPESTNPFSIVFGIDGSNAADSVRVPAV